IYVYTTGIVPAIEKPWKADGLPVRDVALMGKETRREHILTIYDGNGNLIEEWKDVDALHGPGAAPHRVRISPYDPEKHVWLVDEGQQAQILKFTHDGKLVMRVGPDKTKGTCDIAFLPNGDFWVIEGVQGGNRLAKFSKDGNLITEAVTKLGKGPGE